MGGFQLFFIILLAVMIGEGLTAVVIPLLLKRFGVGTQEIPPNVFTGTLQDLLSQLSLLVDQEFMAVVEVPQMTNDLPMITDFEKIQTEIVKNVMFSLSTIFFKKANVMGVKREYLTKFVVRRTSFRMLEYMRNHNFKLRK